MAWGSQLGALSGLSALRALMLSGPSSPRHALSVPGDLQHVALLQTGQCGLRHFSVYLTLYLQLLKAGFGCLLLPPPSVRAPWAVADRLGSILLGPPAPLLFCATATTTTRMLCPTFTSWQFSPQSTQHRAKVVLLCLQDLSCQRVHGHLGLQCAF